MQTFKEYYQNHFEGDEGHKALLPEAEKVFRTLKTTQAILDFSEKSSEERLQKIPELAAYEQMKYYHILGYAIRYAMYAEREAKEFIRQKSADYQRV